MPKCMDCGPRELPESAFYRAAGKKLGKRCREHERRRKDAIRAARIAARAKDPIP